ncbi:MAG: cytochrome d ubiquinol oxidase subunit II [Rhodospirillales bacterium]
MADGSLAAALPTIWAGLIAFAILVYVILDGYDLGVGVLFTTTRDEQFRAEMMDAIAPFWDGNETWLVLVGAALFGAFPMVYAIFLPAFYLPVALLLIGLIFRGVAFEFRYRTAGMRWVWDLGFGVGSTVVAFVQGAAIGTMVQELPVVAGAYAGNGHEWISAFPILCGLGLVIGYALLGAAWLVLKAEGRLQDWAYERVAILLTGTVLFVAIAFVHALITHLRVLNRWLEIPWMLVLPVIGGIACLGILTGVRKRQEGRIFPYAVVVFLTAYATMAISFWPYMIPFSVTIADAAAPTASLEFLFWGAGVVIFPVVLIYTIYVYWIFRGKLRKGYH